MSNTVYLVILHHGGDETIVAACDSLKAAEHAIYLQCRRPTGREVPSNFYVTQMSISSATC